MKQGIHPDYVEATVTCSCGNTFKTHATTSELHIELCNQCHPFYTGQQKFVDTGGRVQRFSDKFGSAATSVMEKEAAEREARQKAHEEAAVAAREARVVKEAGKAERGGKHEVAAHAETAAAAEESVVEAVAEDAGAEAVAAEPAAEADAVVEDVAEAEASEEPAE